MDVSVRDTWEVTPDQVTLTGLDWDAILTEVRDELGLPARRGCGPSRMRCWCTGRGSSSCRTRTRRRTMR